MKPYPCMTALIRFFSYVRFYKGGCWEWCGALNESGYPSFGWNAHNTSGHRIAYWWFVRRPERKEVVDHLCRNPRCVNPLHLEAVSHRENVQRGLGVLPRPVCKRGHPMTPDNVHWQTNYDKSFRTCIICRRLREDTRRAKRRMDVSTTITVARTA